MPFSILFRDVRAKVRQTSIMTSVIIANPHSDLQTRRRRHPRTVYPKPFTVRSPKQAPAPLMSVVLPVHQLGKDVFLLVESCEDVGQHGSDEDVKTAAEKAHIPLVVLDPPRTSPSRRHR